MKVVQTLPMKEAIRQFCKRLAEKPVPVDNSSLPAGSPMNFYCDHCGILLETLPEDYLFRPLQHCSQCKGLEEIGWLGEAKRVSQSQ